MPNFHASRHGHHHRDHGPHQPPVHPIVGTRFDDTLTGTDRNDLIIGLGGDDSMQGGAGNDILLGGRGNDTALYEGSVLDFEITPLWRGPWWAAAPRAILVSSDGGEGTDLLVGVEAAYFAADDYTLHFDGTNNAVLAGDDSAAATEGTDLALDAATLLANDHEFDGDAISIASVDASSALGVAVALVGDQVVYQVGDALDALAEGETATDSFSYTVTDGKGGSDTATVTLTVTGTNDAPALTVAAAVTVDENTTAVTGASATDPDSPAPSFSLSGADAALFTIDASGAIVFAAAPDYEAPGDADGDNVYDITVTATDDFGATDSAAVAVTVADVFELPEVEARINEFHYDNSGSDSGEFVELRVRAGDDVSSLALELVNGNGGAVYNTLAVSDGTMTTDGTWDYYVLATPGLQNGSPDGIVLANGPELIEFLSYEGSFTAADGTAAGVTSTDIGPAESSATPTGFSLQRLDDGSWDAPRANTSGADNAPALDARINEFHYDNAGSDSGEFIELRTNVGADASGLTVELVNGNGGAVYNTLAIADATMTSDGSWNYYVFDLPSNGLQNGSPDGIVLADGADVVEFLSYEGSFAATSGAATGMTSTDIGPSEPGSTPLGDSLQRAADGSWYAPHANTAGAENTAPPLAFEARINELHYDNAGGDTGEFVELRVTAGADASGLAVELYNGSNGTVYNTLAIADAAMTSDSSWDYYVFDLPANGLQNGSPDGLALSNAGALIEFLSYEGTMTGAGGAADGVMSEDIGVAEASDTAIGLSLQRAEDGSWFGPDANTSGATNDPVPQIVISEIMQNPSAVSDSAGEWFEVYNAGPVAVDMNGWTIADNGADSHVIDNGGPLMIGPGDYLVLGNNADSASNGGVAVAYQYSGVTLANGDDEIVLTDTTGTEIDRVAYDGGPAFPDPAGASMALADLATDNNVGANWTTSTAPFGDGDLGTPGAANGGGGTGPTPLLISEIQGAGYESPYVAQSVTVSAIVTHIAGTGFYLQEEDADADADVLTSEGIFVFTGGGDAISLGDLVEVTGDVTEYFGMTEITSVSAVTVQSSGMALPGATLVLLSPDTAQAFESLEGMRVSVGSGTADPLSVIENFNLDRYGEVAISAGVQYQATQLYDAQTQAAEIADHIAANANASLLLDDGSSVQNPDHFDFIPGGAGDNGNGYLDAGDDFSDTGSTFRLGTELTANAEGIMNYGFGDWRVTVTDTLQVDEATNVGAREAAPDDVGGSLQVASYNVLNYFTTLDVSGAGTGPDGTLNPRGADTASEFDRQSAKIVEGIIGTGAEVLALQEIENNGTGPGSAIDTLVSQLNAEGTGASYAHVDPTGTGGFVGTDAIMAGIIYDENAVTLTHAEVLDYTETTAAATYALAKVLSDGIGSHDIGDYDRNRPSVAATFTDNDSGESFTVVASHFKSKGDSGLAGLADAAQGYVDGGGTAITQADIDALKADPNFDQGDGQGFWNAVRAEAAGELAGWITTDYDGGGTTNVVMLGDMNAYAKEDPVQALTDGAGFTDLVDTFIGQDQAYSYVFDGQRGSLDQGLADAALAALVTGATEWHINADEPDLIAYDESFTDPAFYNPGVFASSDHDPLIVGLDLTGGLLIT